jgi:hypothetical protein
VVVCNLEVIIELNGISEHQSGHPLKLLGGQVFLELLQIALESLLVYKRKLGEDRCARVTAIVIAEHGDV